MIVGFFLGAAIAVYMYLHPHAIGFSFPNINGELAISPTFSRISVYLFGRWLGYCLIGIIFGWLGFWVSYPLVARLAISACTLLSIFMLLFLVITYSPEFMFAEYSDASRLSSSVFFKGLLSSGILIAPNLIGILMVMIKYQCFSGILFFTNLFLGNTLFSLPILLNMKWSRNIYCKCFLRSILFICAGIVLIISVKNLFNS